MTSAVARIVTGDRAANGSAWTLTWSGCFTRSRIVCNALVILRRSVWFRLAKGGTWMQRWRVPLGFACAALFFLLSRPRPLTLIIGGAVALPGLALRAWATGYLRKNDVLATAGPYAYTRNPLYLGSFLIGLGFTIAAGRIILGLVFAALFVGIYVPVMRVESATLEELF